MGSRILLIEDEANIADYLVTGLREEGYAVEHAPDGDTGRRCLESRTWDLVLLDWWLPGEDGLSLLRGFGARPTDARAIPDRPRSGGLSRPRAGKRCRRLPVQAVRLRRIAGPRPALIRRRQGEPEAILSHGDLTIDLVAQQVKRGGRPLELSGKELALLIFFLRRPDRVLTRSEIYEQVWQEPFDQESNTLGVHIMELRRKIESLGPRLIHTVRGRGYSFGAMPALESEGRP